MNKLLAANLVRLKKDKLFWLGILFMFGFCIYFIVDGYISITRNDYIFLLDDYFYVCTIMIGIVLSIFCSLFLGTEYSDGTIRNKLVVGHTRSSIYLASLLTCGIASFFLLLAYMLPALLIGIPLFGFFSAPVKTVLLTVLGCLLLSLAYSALLTLLSMLIQSKAVAAVIAVAGVFVLLFSAATINSKLYEPEYYSGHFVNEDGFLEEMEPTPNPSYITGSKRFVYETALDIIPAGQAFQLASGTVKNPWRLPLYSLGIIVLSTGIGLLLFQRKEIK